MPISIIFTAGRLAGRSFGFPDGAAVLLGRGSGSDVELPDEGVSRAHCRVICGAPPVLEELGSRNGTFVNGRRVAGRVALAPGDVVVAGTAAFRVEGGVASPAAAPGARPSGGSGEHAAAGRRKEAITEVLVRLGVGEVPVCARCGGTVPGAVAFRGMALLCADCRRALAAGAPQIGRFVVLAELGKGASASVYRGMDETGRLVALKVFPLLPDASDRRLQRIVREARLLSKLDHPNIVALHEAGRAASVLYFALEHVDGADLQSELDRTGPLRPDQAAGVGRQVCAALAHAHAQGVVHRDLKPSNLLLSAGGAVKVTDFGLAKTLDAARDDGLTASGTMLGTPYYASPEQTRSAKHADARSDIYSLGATLHHFLFGEPPYAQVRTVPELLDRMESPEPVSTLLGCRADVPPELDAVLRAALDKDPSRRPSLAEMDAVLARVAPAGAT